MVTFQLFPELEKTGGERPENAPWLENGVYTSWIPLLIFSDGSDGKASAYNAGDLDSVPGLGRSPGEGNGNPLQYSCPENPMDGGGC